MDYCIGGEAYQAVKISQGVVLLGDVVLLEKVWHCWKKCVSVHFLMPVDQDVELLLLSSTMSVCTLPYFLP